LSPKFAASSEITEKNLNLDRETLRDIQARLLVIGHDPNGVDGIVGRGTRNAVKAWQSSHGLDNTGFLSEAQVAFLRETSQEMLDDWLKIRTGSIRNSVYEAQPMRI
jgi:peptidoglycan hydrolase-like protein with peptidoglycan-binding domain